MMTAVAGSCAGGGIVAAFCHGVVLLVLIRRMVRVKISSMVGICKIIEQRSKVGVLSESSEN